MRLKHLLLSRYGHLTGLELRFPDSPGLHIVLGVNEAGKSTALAAIGDCLFGFPHRTPYAFLHGNRDLRLGVTLLARDGRQASFVRMKRRDGLFDDQDRPLPESAIAVFLAGATRDRFNRVFGLNGAELRQGGDAILKGQGEVGEAILGAHTGLHGFRPVAEQLDSDAGKLFGDKRGRRAFHEAADRFNRARHDIAERRIDHTTWKQATDERTALERSRADNVLRAAHLHAERSRLDRIRRTTPARLALTRLLEERNTLGVVPDLPADAAERHAEATAARDQAERDLTREQGRLETLSSALQALPEQPAILDFADAIDALALDRQRIAAAVSDRGKQQLRAAQQAALIEDEGRRLGLALDADALSARIPNALGRETVNHALRRHAQLSGQQASAADMLAAAELRLSDAQAALGALPDVEPVTGLREAIGTVKEEGRLDAALADAASALQAARDDLARALASLPLWDGDAAALTLAPVPLDADIQRASDALKQRHDALQTIELRLAEHGRALEELAAQLAADDAAGELPTAAAIQAARVRRDKTWALIRRDHLGGPGDTSADTAAALDLSDPVAQFAALIEAADALADRRAAEQERVVTVEQRRAQQMHRQFLRDADDRRRSDAAARLSEAQAHWRALWQPTGVEPAEPAAMREWLQKRAAVLAEDKRVRDTAQLLDSIRQRHAGAMAALAALLPAEAATAGQSLATLLRAAERTCQDRETRAEARAKAREALATAVAEHRKAERAGEKLTGAMAAWRADWATAARTLSLPSDATVELGATALTLWDAIDTAARSRQEAGNRVAEMTADIDRFRAETCLLANRLALGLAGTDPLDVVPDLSRRLAAAREDKRRRDDLTAEIADCRQAINTIVQQQRAVHDVLDWLRAQAAAADLAALSDIIQAWIRCRELKRQIEHRDAELHSLDDGRTLRELVAEADGIEFDSIPARIAEIDAELRALSAQDLQNQERITQLNQALAEMEKGRDAAVAAQQMETALADIDDIAARYVPLRMAQILLKAGIERFRRQQQGPLLDRAGQLFARLTEGRYDRLGVDEDDDGKAVVIAYRPDETACPAERLSEGTLDQLYLALRLAAIEGDAHATEPLPFIGDDLLVNFDDRRARAALRVLADFAKVTQVILFTHHSHLADMAGNGLASVHILSAEPVFQQIAGKPVGLEA